MRAAHAEGMQDGETVPDGWENGDEGKQTVRVRGRGISFTRDGEESVRGAGGELVG